MNDKDKEALYTWIDNDVLSQDETTLFKNMSEQERVVFVTERTWQAACEYKDKEIETVINENTHYFKSLTKCEDKLEKLQDEKKSYVKL